MTRAEFGERMQLGAEELLRIWRMTRTHHQAPYPPAIDGILRNFFLQAGQRLQAGQLELNTWNDVEGMLRLIPESNPRIIAQEWDWLQEVLDAVCHALEVDKFVLKWLSDLAATWRTQTLQMENELRHPLDSTPEKLIVIYLHAFALRTSNSGENMQ